MVAAELREIAEAEQSTPALEICNAPTNIRIREYVLGLFANTLIYPAIFYAVVHVDV